MNSLHGRYPYTAGRLLLAIALLLGLLFGTPPTQTQAENAGYALAFDGINDLLLLTHTAWIMASTWPMTKTVEVWVKPEGPAVICPNNSVAMCDLIFSDRPVWWGISRGIVNGLDRIWIFSFDGTTDQFGVPYTAGEWVHIAMVHNDGIIRVYRNGLEIGVMSSGATLQPPTGALPVLHIGGVIVNSTRNYTFRGQIDEVRLWNTARSAVEIQNDRERELNGDEAGLASYYRMSNGSGLTVSDDSLNNWDGTLLDGGSGVPPNGTYPQWVASEAFGTPPPTPTTVTPEPTTVTPEPTTVTPEPTTVTPEPTTPVPTTTPVSGAGFALALDGVNDLVQLAATSQMLASTWASTKTIELWVKPEGTAITCANNSVSTCDIIFGDKPTWWGISRGIVNGLDRIWIFNFDGTMDQIGVPYSAGEWVHIAMVHNNGTMQVYRNGLQISAISSGATLQPPTGTSPVLFVGGIIVTSTRNYTSQGQIDEVRLWNTARSAAEIQNDMLRTLTGSEAGLAAYYQMSDEAGSTLTDDSLNNWNGTLLDGGWGVPPNGTYPQWVIPGPF